MAIFEPDQVHRLTPEQYLELSEAHPEAFDRTELVNGVVYDMAAQYMPHARTVRWFFRQLEMALPTHEVFFSGSVLAGRGLPEPDVFVLKSGMPWNGDGPFLGERLLLVVEVAASTRVRDLQAKPLDYAAAGIPHYWVVDLDRDEFVVHRVPSGSGYWRVERGPIPTVQTIGDWIESLNA